VVHPGDIIVGDDDGVLAMRQDEVAAVIEGARRQAEKENKALQSIRDSHFDREWLGPHESKMMGS
jgi:regulator of RNase E activity RraA